MTKYFKETTARKNWTCSGCNSVIGQGETYWRLRTSKNICFCFHHFDESTFADENIKESAETYGRASDYEQVMMEDYGRQNPRPNIVFIAKKR